MTRKGIITLVKNNRTIRSNPFNTRARMWEHYRDFAAIAKQGAGNRYEIVVSYWECE